MQYLNFFWITISVCGASLVVFTLLFVLNFAAPRMATKSNKDFAPTTYSAAFLFHNEVLTNTDCKIEPLPWSNQKEISDWSDLRSWFGKRFGPLPVRLSELSHKEHVDFHAFAENDPATLRISSFDGAKRIEVFDPTDSGPALTHYAKQLDALVGRFGTVLNQAPCAIRVFDKVHETAWHNEWFEHFPKDHANLLLKALPTLEDGERVHLPAQNMQKEKYLELTHVDEKEFQVVYVNDVTQVVQAEKARREFIQTLTKTFASLPTGLAIFDKTQKLALFNPALLDLTGLQAPFLSGQPQLIEFFDRLRDKNMLPEPKSYKTWRNQIESMISSASLGLYSEDWSLSNGLTYRITGRPHPDGAVAFLFENISDDLASRRRIRGQVDISKAALDAVDHAIAIVGPANTILLCNKTCSQFLKLDPKTSFVQMALKDFFDACAEKLPHIWFWDACEKAVLNREELQRVLQKADESEFMCRVSALPGNAMNISIRYHQKAVLSDPQIEDISA